MITQNTFTEGMIKDLNPLTTPKTALTDALNATVITYNGDEFVLQNDMGNAKVERAKLPPGFIPLGMKEYGGIIYVVSYNPETGDREIGSFPSPERDFNTTDFEELDPVNFKTSQFIVPTNDLSVIENTIAVGKLFEPELFVLHPGDKYVVTYTIHDPTSESPADEIDHEDKVGNFISSDEEARKLFRLKFYKITEDNNLAELEDGSIKVISKDADIENEYVFFKENSSSTLALGMKLEELDYFDANVVNTSSRISATKQVAVEAIGFSDSMQDFKGIRLDVVEPTRETFFIDKKGITRKVSAIIGDLPANSKFKGSIIPYSEYNLFPKLKKEFDIDLGVYETFDDVNNTYRFLYTEGVGNNGGYLTVDFDFRFEGEKGEGIDIYMEFYDLQEDYSIIQKIDNSTFYGNMKLQVELEAKNATPYRSGAATNPALLMKNPDTSFLKSILSSTNTIRTDGKLKRDYFYIVRISGVDRILNEEQSGFTYKHYDIYKGIYTHDMFNNEYNNSPDIKDFNTLDFKKDVVKYTPTIVTVSTSPEVETAIDDSKYKTGENYYRIIKAGEIDNIPANKKYIGGYNIKKTRSDSIRFNLTGYDNYFGDFKTDLIKLQSPITLADGTYTSLIDEGFKPIEKPYDRSFNDINAVPDFVASWVINKVSDKEFNLLADITTSRKVIANLRKQEDVILRGTQIIKPTHLLKFGGMFQTPGVTVPHQSWDYGDARSVIHWQQRDNERSPLVYVKDNGQRVVYANSLIDEGGNRGLDLASVIEQNESVKWSAWIASTADSSTFDQSPINGSYSFDAATANNNSRAKFPMPQGPNSWKANFLIIRTDDGDAQYRYRLALSDTTIDKAHKIEDIIAFYDNLGVVSKYSGTGDIYAVSDTETIISAISTGVLTTTVEFPSLPFKSVMSLENEGKTYLSRFFFKAQSKTVDFKTSVINDYIASKQLPGTLASKIKDGFIPYITQEVISEENVKVPDLTINGLLDGKINQIIAQLVGDKDKWQDDKIVFDNDGGYNHGDVVYLKPDNRFNSPSWLKNSFKAEGTIGNPELGVFPDPNGIYLTFQDTSTRKWLRRKDSGSKSATDKWSIQFKEWISDTHNFNYARG